MRTQKSSDRLRYIENLFAPEDEGLRAIRHRLAENGREGINIGPSEGRLLQVLMRLGRIRTVVEVGTLYGYSTVWIARALPAGGRVFTIEKDAVAARFARAAFAECGVADRVELLEGAAEDKLRELEARGPFDMIFIDCNKRGYVSVLDWAMENVRQGGLVAADNTFLFGAVVSETKPDVVSQKQWEEMRRFNQRMADPAVFTSVLVPTDEGLTVGVKQGACPR